MLTTTVKASSISNLTDARYFAAWHVDWLGFDLTPDGLAAVSLQEILEIKNWIEGPKMVGELAVFDVIESQQIIDFLELENIQVGMHTPVEYLNSLTVNSIIKEVIIEPSMTYEALKKHLSTYFDYVDYFLINFDKNKLDWMAVENGTTLTIVELQEICQQYEVFLSMDFVPTNIKKILSTIQPLGISVKGGMEEKVGLKSYDELDEVFELLEEEE
ncbi:MAG: hypothetical protein AB8G86_08615 [Saprospiraceae bacterium]